MKRLFICDRQYSLYRTLIKCVNDTDNWNDLLITNVVSGTEKLYPILQKESIFKNVFFYDDDLIRKFSKNKGAGLSECRRPLKAARLVVNQLKEYCRHQKESKYIRLPEGLDIKQYEEIYVNDGFSTLVFYLRSQKKSFICVEHAKNAFQPMLPSWIQTLSNRMMPILDKLGIAYAPRGTSKWVEAIEVNQNCNLRPEVRKKEIREVNIDKLLEAMNDEDKNRIFDIYCKAYGLTLDCSKPVHIILTCPLFNDGVVHSEKDQVEAYKNLIERMIGTYDNVWIKPHPRDTVDYQVYFPGVPEIDRGISAEILNLSSSLKIAGVYGFITSSMDAFTTAERKVWFSLAQVKDFLD